MGYTHYWKLRDGGKRTTDRIAAGYEKALPLLKDIAKRHRRILCRDYDTPKVPAELNGERVWLNGKGDNGHESFVFSPSPVEFSCCKTERKPYDLPVSEMLLALANHIPDMELSSDGFYMDFDYDESGGVIAGLDGHWRQAVEKVEELYGIKFMAKVERSPANYTLKDGRKAVYRKIILHAA